MSFQRSLAGPAPPSAVSRQNHETGNRKVSVERQRLPDAELAHDREAASIGERAIQIGKTCEPVIDRLLFALRGNVLDPVRWSPDRFEEGESGHASRTTKEQSVRLGHNGTGGHDSGALPHPLPQTSGQDRMVGMTAVGEGIPRAGVDEEALHSDPRPPRTRRRLDQEAASVAAR